VTDPDAYHQGVLALKQSPYLHWPAHVHLETFAQCNAACRFCPYPELDRIGTRMPDSLIEKIVGDLGDIPKSLQFQLSPFKVNEPFLDHRLFDILALINGKLPNASITLTSNGTPLTDKKIAQLAEVRNLAYLWISFNDHRPAHYEESMSLPYGRTMERLHLLHHKKAIGEVTCRIVLSRVGDGSPTDGEFAYWVKTVFPCFEAFVFRRGNWLHQVRRSPSAGELDVPHVACRRWFELSITATGTVAHCCMDGKAAYPIGDVRQQHALEIYNSPGYRHLREHVLDRHDAEPCNACSFF
jgi:hypothetical protein